MTNEPSINEPRRPLRSCLNIFGKCLTCRQIHALVHCLWQVVKGIVILVFFLWAFGLPGGWVANKLNPYIDPYTISIQRVTWSPLHGLIVHHPEVIEPTLGSVPIFTADSLFIHPDYPSLLNKGWQTKDIGIKNGRLLLPVCHTNSGIAIIDYMDLHDIEGKMAFIDGKSKTEITATSDIGARCFITGTFGESEMDHKMGPALWIEQIHAAHLSLYSTPLWILAVRERLDEMNFVTQPEFTATFEPDKNNLKTIAGSATLKSKSFQYRGVAYDGIQVDISLEDNRYTIQQARLDRGNHAFTFDGSYIRSNDVFEGHAQNDLPMDAVSVFFPDSWQEKMTNAGMRFSGSLRCEAWAGPCKLQDAPRNWSGWLSIKDAVANELMIDRAFASLKRSKNTFTVDDGIIKGGTGIGAGAITFSTKSDFLNKKTTGNVNLGIDLKQLYPFLNKGMKRFSNDLDIQERPARFVGNFSIPHENPKATVITGEASGTNLSYRTVFLSGFNTLVSYGEGILVLDAFSANCQTGTVKGLFVFDIPSNIFGMDIAVTADPSRIGPSAGTNFFKKLKPFTFSDNILLLLDGVVYPKSPENTELDIYLSGTGIGRTNWATDHLRANGRLANNHLSVTNLGITMFGGTITGVVDITVGAGETNVSLSATATNLSMDRIVKHMRPGNTNHYEGFMDGFIEVSGPFPDRPEWRTISGSGGFQIRDGKLMRVPIFGGLSSLLSKIYPGLGFAEQNQCTATFVIKDGAITSRNLKILGSVLSFSAKGQYSFADELDFGVQVKPLRKGLIAGTLRLVTIPLTKLLEFKVSGSIKDPKWEAAYIPLL